MVPWAEVYEKFIEDLELLELAVGDFDQEEFLLGLITPLTFGSAKNNWGVDLFYISFQNGHLLRPKEKRTKEWWSLTTLGFRDLFLRFRPIWTRGIEIGLPLFEFAPESLNEA